MSHLETILLATDGSAASQAAQEEALLLAAEVGARLLVVSVINTTAKLPAEAVVAGGGPRGLVDLREALVTGAQGIVERARAAGAGATFLVWEGDPGEAIVAAAEAEGVDLIVVGSHGRGPVGRFLIGSVSDYVVRHARCPVLVVRPRQEAPLPARTETRPV